jgi:hypothetical protein
MCILNLFWTILTSWVKEGKLSMAMLSLRISYTFFTDLVEDAGHQIGMWTWCSIYGVRVSSFVLSIFFCKFYRWNVAWWTIFVLAHMERLNTVATRPQCGEYLSAALCMLADAVKNQLAILCHWYWLREGVSAACFYNRGPQKPINGPDMSLEYVRVWFTLFPWCFRFSHSLRAFYTCYYCNALPKFSCKTLSRGHAVAYLLEGLCYKPESRGFESRWSGFFLIYLILPATTPSRYGG